MSRLAAPFCLVAVLLAAGCEDTSPVQSAVPQEAGFVKSDLPRETAPAVDPSELDALVALKMAVFLLDEDLILDVDGNDRVNFSDARQILQIAVRTGGGR